MGFLFIVSNVKLKQYIGRFNDVNSKVGWPKNKELHGLYKLCYSSFFY